MGKPDLSNSEFSEHISTYWSNTITGRNNSLNHQNRKQLYSNDSIILSNIVNNQSFCEGS